MFLKAAAMTHAVQVPGSFEGHAARLGYSVAALIWVLADDFCARPPRTLLEIVLIPQAKPVGRHVFLTSQPTCHYPHDGGTPLN